MWPWAEGQQQGEAKDEHKAPPPPQGNLREEQGHVSAAWGRKSSGARDLPGARWRSSDLQTLICSVTSSAVSDLSGLTEPFSERLSSF